MYNGEWMESEIERIEGGEIFFSHAKHKKTLAVRLFNIKSQAAQKCIVHKMSLAIAHKSMKKLCER